MSNEYKRVSKQLSYVLRHRPDTIGIQLDSAGWVVISELLQAMQSKGRSITRAQLQRVVEQNDKQRFAISDDGTRIRANQGHSVDIELGYEAAEPPELLYHGTVSKFLDSIRIDGLRKGNRHHVHLSRVVSTASAVGLRRGQPIILQVRSQLMHEQGHAFFVTPNQVWLTEQVPAPFIVFPET